MARVHNVVGEVLLLPFAATMSNPHVGIVNYGSGNIQSLRNALEHLGVSVRLVTLDGEFDRLTHLMLPGVGAFGYCSHRLKSSGLLPAIERWAMMEHGLYLVCALACNCLLILVMSMATKKV